MPKTSCVPVEKQNPRRPGVRPATILHLLDTTEYSLHADIHEETTHGAPSPPPRRVPGVPVKNGRTGRHEHARYVLMEREASWSLMRQVRVHIRRAMHARRSRALIRGGGARGVAENVSSRPSSSVRNILTSALLTKSRTLRHAGRDSSQRQSAKVRQARGYNLAFFVWAIAYWGS